MRQKNIAEAGNHKSKPPMRSMQHTRYAPKENHVVENPIPNAKKLGIPFVGHLVSPSTTQPESYPAASLAIFLFFPSIYGA